MKSFFKFLTVIFVLAMSLLTRPSALHAQTIDTIDYIKNIETETVVLVSNNLLGGEIYSHQEENNTNSCGTEPLVLTFLSHKNLLTDSNSRLSEKSIHNLSTNLKDIQQIRAP